MLALITVWANTQFADESPFLVDAPYPERCKEMDRVAECLLAKVHEQCVGLADNRENAIKEFEAAGWQVIDFAEYMLPEFIKPKSKP